MFDICKTSPNITKSEGDKIFTVPVLVTNQTSNRESMGIKPTSTVYINHLVFLSVMLLGKFRYAHAAIDNWKQNTPE